ncbi:energy transducer TonB [Trinickia dinghuensis]|uniref:Energy transducer TonB n=1 Tax=Trinickia dinghuensis TaxID=2291023 RepID=A0A3D8K075_9BURK|nr:energy transducer TonB [Trinickia dinghuensis]
MVTKTVGGQQITCDIPLPKYPSEARKLHQTGTVIVRITIWPPNIVKQLTVMESSGNTTFDAAAMRAAEGTVCTSTERRFQLFQSFEFDLRNDSDAQAGENEDAFAQ